jgi:hypothetical protein
MAAAKAISHSRSQLFSTSSFPIHAKSKLLEIIKNFDFQRLNPTDPMQDSRLVRN